MRIFKGLLSIFWFSVLSFSVVAEPIRMIQTTEKVVALTFDDGPHPKYTREILDILDKHQVVGTFFVLGSSVLTYPKIVKEMIQKGHEIGNHSMNHNSFKKRSEQKIIKEVLEVDRLIKDLGYPHEIHFRSPYGHLSKRITKALESLNKKHILFSYLPKDWENPRAQVITQRILTRIEPGFIITLHDGGKGRTPTVQATEEIIIALKEKGYQFLSVSEILKKGPGLNKFSRP